MIIKAVDSGVEQHQHAEGSNENESVSEDFRNFKLLEEKDHHQHGGLEVTNIKQVDRREEQHQYTEGPEKGVGHHVFFIC